MLHSFEIFSFPVLHRYRASVFSKAALLNAVIAFFTYAVPLLLAYRSYGFWLKTDSFMEQPTVHFKHQYIFIGDVIGSQQGPIFCSTYNHISTQFADQKNRCPIIKAKETDSNHDGKNDEVYFELNTLLDNEEDIHGVTLILLFDYRLQALCNVNLEGLAVIQYNHPLPGGELKVVADLNLLQRTPFGKRFGPNEQLEDILAVDKEESFDIGKLLESYAKRNASIQLRRPFYTWTAGRASLQNFKLNVKLLIIPQKIEYVPGFWQVMKWAWLQYLSLLLVVRWMANNLRFYIFTNHLVPVVKMPLPWTKQQF
ncbi:Hypothetical predicted protein [Cloeon dipterum]|uniref:Transmembrane protein 231 n=1 Tax=Cloeon dipterum TaxID=197152 RepID=A0A8S1CMU2_9INSE|nr:Hypothetical predicted protein [Cloeon dipterum]